MIVILNFEFISRMLWYNGSHNICEIMSNANLFGGWVLVFNFEFPTKCSIDESINFMYLF